MKRFFAVALALLLTTGAFAQKKFEKNTALDDNLAKVVATAIAAASGTNKAGVADAFKVINAYYAFA